VQQLTFEGQPLLQFVYLGKQGEPVAICVVPARKVETPRSKQYVTEFSGMNVVQANSDDSTYIIVSKEAMSILEKIPSELSINL